MRVNIAPTVWQSSKPELGRSRRLRPRLPDDRKIDGWVDFAFRKYGKYRNAVFALLAPAGGSQNRVV
jgi:hypothetical protein